MADRAQGAWYVCPPQTTFSSSICSCILAAMIVPGRQRENRILTLARVSCMTGTEDTIVILLPQTSDSPFSQTHCPMVSTAYTNVCVTCAQAIPFGARPATPMGSYAPPGTASGRVVPPGTRGNISSRGGAGGQPRLMTGRPGTPGGGAYTNGADGLLIAERPVTQQGMVGMRGGAAQGPRRQVQDRNYYRDLLLKKKEELASVIEELEARFSAAERDSGAAAQLGRAHDALARDVKKKQGELADVNIVLGIVHGKAQRAEDMERDLRVLRERNDAERRRMDTAFTNRQVMEKKIKEMERQVAAQQQEMESMLNELAPDKRNRYFELQGEHKALSNEMTRLEADLDTVGRQVTAAEAELASSVVKQRALATHEQIAELDSRKHDLEDEIRTLSLSPEEQKEQLLHKIRTDRAEVERLDGAMKDILVEVGRLESKIRSSQAAAMSASSNEDGGENETSAGKYETLLRQEKELNEFMDEFPEATANVHAEIESLRTQEAELRQQIEKYDVMERSLPSKQRFAEMQDELKYKEEQVNNATETSVRLQDELEARQQELEKIDTLEEKMASEIETIHSKMSTMKEEIATYKQLDRLAADEEQTRNRLEADRVRLGRYRDGLATVVGEKAAKLDAKRSQLAGHDTFQSLDRLEERLRTLQQTNFATSEYVSNKNAEGDYSKLRDEVLDLADLINQHCVRAAAEMRF